jgi:HNH endonuclease
MHILPENFRDQLFEWFTLDTDQGKLFWKKRPGYRIQIGSEAGSLKITGSQRKRQAVVIKFNGKFWLRSRLIFLIAKGYLPDSLDHINGDSTDDRPVNLRAASPSQNACNRQERKDKESGLPKGVRFRPYESKSKPFFAEIQINSHAKRIGGFLTIAEAEAAYKELANKLHGQYAFNPEKRVQSRLDF